MLRKYEYPISPNRIRGSRNIRVLSYYTVGPGSSDPPEKNN